MKKKHRRKMTREEILSIIIQSQKINQGYVAIADIDEDFKIGYSI